MIIKLKENGKLIQVIQYCYKTHGEWKIKLTMIINFISPKDSDEIRTLRTNSHNTDIMMVNKTDKTIEELFKPFCKMVILLNG